jgi:N12 class adenine-specific DNA methylase
VPNHMLEQFSREWLQLYPQARLLAASSDDLAGDKRRAFVARVATNDWDAVLMTRSAFERLPVSPDIEAAYIERQCEQLRAMLTNAKGGQGLTVKRLEKALLRGQAALERRLDGAVDPGITFESTGIDYLAIDELHDYKNLRTESNIRDAAIDGSNRATDLHLKTEYLRQRHGHRVITGATATPIANSVTEAHVMQRYLRPDLLAEAGVLDFDAWAATFGQTVTEIEMAPTGGGNYRMQTRFARFQNVPEMLRMWHVFADVKTAEDLQLPTPELSPRGDGQRLPETVLVDASPEVSAYVADLGQRAEAVRAKAVTPEEDNMLKISTDGRKAALDMRIGRRRALLDAE